MKTLAALIAIVMMIGSLAAVSPGGPFLSPNLNSDGLFDLNKLRMNHSVSFMSGFSSGGEGFYQSTYTNHLRYSFNPRLDLNIDLNFVNFGTASHDSGFSFDINDDNSSIVVPEFSLEYRPTDSSVIKIEYRQQVNPYSSHNFRRW